MKIPTNRNEAIASGSKTYRTGKPCALGGVAERHTKSKNCLCALHKAAEAERKKAYYDVKRDHLLAYASEYQSGNKERSRKYRSRYIAKNPEAVKEAARDWYEKNKDITIERARQWLLNNKDRALFSRKQWKLENPMEARERAQRLKQRLSRRTPSWFSEFDKFVMTEAYDLAVERSRSTGIVWHVDHMIPLYSRLASGLHVGLNVQVIPANLNLLKGNRMVLTESYEWLDFI